jgi:hypothetical protein
MNSRAVDHIRRRPAGVSARQTASAVGRGPTPCDFNEFQAYSAVETTGDVTCKSQPRLNTEDEWVLLVRVAWEDTQKHS